MKIKSIKAIAVNLSPNPKTQPRVELDANGGYFVSPMDRYKYDIKYRSSTNWNRVACVVTAEDGTWGLGTTIHSGPVVSIINDHFSLHSLHIIHLQQMLHYFCNETLLYSIYY